MNKKQLKEKIKDLPVNVSVIGWALLWEIGERRAIPLSEILKGLAERMGRSLRRTEKKGTFWDYYSELKNLKENSARTTLWRLEKNGLVKKEQRKYQLTFKGLKIVKNFQVKAAREDIWDGRWRLVMFDIPEKKREERDWLRWQLLTWDYKPLQKSVFIGKHVIERDFYSECIERGLKDFIRLITIGEIDEENF